METIINELGISGNSINPTYSKIRTSLDTVVKRHLRFFDNPKYEKIRPTEKQESVPKIYWTPKLHKTPIKSRFIAGSRSCTTKKLSGILTNCLQVVKDQRKAYCDAIYKNSQVNSFWILKNSKDLIEHIENVATNPITHISTWDFSTLYTTIPHVKLKFALKQIITSVMSKDSYSVMNCNASRAFLSSETNTKYLSLDAKELCTLVCYLIDNIYVKFGPHLFRQTIGIPMGTDCAPLLADLFLHYYEYKFMESCMKTNIHLARKFNNTFRYIDDLQSQNNPQFGLYVQDIYPEELELKETSRDLAKLQTNFIQRPVSYLDLMFYFDKDGFLCYKLYDKRDDFNFDIVNFPFMCSNIPSGPAYGVYISQLIRYSRACLFYNDFLQRHIDLVKRLVSQGFSLKRLRKTFNKFYDSYEHSIAKYKITKDKMSKDAKLF